MQPGIPEIAETLAEIATLMELCGENTFKVRAHANAARVVETWGGTLEQLLTQSKAGKVRGVGEGLAQRIGLISAGQPDPELQEMKARLPPGLFDMLRIPGLGPKKVRALWTQLDLSSIDQLEQACKSDAVASLKGFGKKTQANILEGIERQRQYANKFLLSDATRHAARLVDFLKSDSACVEVSVAGSLRRSKEIVGDLDIVVGAHEPKQVIERFLAAEGIIKILSQGETKVSVLIQSGMQVDLRVVAVDEFSTALAYFTGSKDHNTRLRARAQSMGLKLNEYGLFSGDERKVLKTEEEIYSALNLCFVPPELREDRGEIEVAEEAFSAKSQVPDLVQRSDLRGLMHSHTTYSDGRNTIKEMALAAQERGYEYLVVTDHSRSAAYAGGLSIERVLAQHSEIEKLNEQFAPFRIFKGIESDILSSGELDYPEEVLVRFEVVIASVHSNFTMGEREMTDRILSAVRNRHTTCLGHLTGRLLLEREGYRVNVAEVLKVCAAEGVAVEINANPHRLDLDWRFHASAVEQGLLLPICPDAHSIEGMDDVVYGIGVARKGGLSPRHIANCFSRDKFVSWSRQRRA